MKRPRNDRPEPRTELIGLNLTDADLAQLDELFAALRPTASRQRNLRRFTRSTVAYQCFATGLDHYLQGKPNPRPAKPDDWDSRPKRSAKLVGIYLSETDCKKLIKLDSVIERRFWGSFLRRGQERRPFQFRKPTTLAYGCFRMGLSLMLKLSTSASPPNAPRSAE
jgi:hypothetical protein